MKEPLPGPSEMHTSDIAECGTFWREFLQGEDSGGEKDLRRATKTGRALVDHEPLARMEKKTGRNLQKGKPGRKPPESMK